MGYHKLINKEHDQLPKAFHVEKIIQESGEISAYDYDWTYIRRSNINQKLRSLSAEDTVCGGWDFFTVWKKHITSGLYSIEFERHRTHE